MDHPAESGGRRDELAAPTRESPGGYYFKTQNLDEIMEVLRQAALNSEDGLVEGWVRPVDQKVWARCRKKGMAIRALKTTSNTGMMTDRVKIGRRIVERVEEI